MSEGFAGLFDLVRNISLIYVAYLLLKEIVNLFKALSERRLEQRQAEDEAERIEQHARDVYLAMRDQYRQLLLRDVTGSIFSLRSNTAVGPGIVAELDYLQRQINQVVERLIDEAHLPTDRLLKLRQTIGMAMDLEDMLEERQAAETPEQEGHK